MTLRVAVLGAGVGGLSAAIRLAQAGHEVVVYEARDTPGGLASSFVAEGTEFDFGPYVLLDKPGLAWVLSKLGIPTDALTLRELDPVYQVQVDNGSPLIFHRNPAATAAGFEELYPGCGRKYERFVRDMVSIQHRLAPFRYRRPPGILDILRTVHWRELLFLQRSLRSELNRYGFSPALRDAIGVWTHVSGNNLDSAPSPLALVPGLIHSEGAYVLQGGIAAIARLLTAEAVRLGVTLRLRAQVKRIFQQENKVKGIELTNGEHVPASLVVSNLGLATYLSLLDPPLKTTEWLKTLPLQSPGVAAYLLVQGALKPPYLKFALNAAENRCRLLVQPGIPWPDKSASTWHPARLLRPLRHAEKADAAQAALTELLAEPWWQEGIGKWRIVKQLTPQDWGAEFNLYRGSMNPVMTAKFMRHGRVPHRSEVRGLYLAGSATHPGQWVSFSAISGVLAADALLSDERTAVRVLM